MFPILFAKGIIETLFIIC